MRSPTRARSGTSKQRYPFDAQQPDLGHHGEPHETARIAQHQGGHLHRASPAARATPVELQRRLTTSTPNASNPFDTNFGFANALLGSINSYTESTSRPFAEGRFNQIEFFGQDNWRVSSRLTLDLGMRFVHNGADLRRRPERRVLRSRPQWDPAKAPKLYEPVCPGNATTCSGTARIARNPLTGELLNNTYIGKLVPGSGDFFNGMVVAEGTPPQYSNNDFYPSPRVGFAWDVAGDGKTSVRGGFGINYDRYQDDDILQLVEQPPLMLTMQTNWTTLPQLLSSQLIQNPRPVQRLRPTWKPLTVYSWSVGVQRELPWKFMADVAYVGNSNTNVARNIPINSLTPAQLVDPANLDPTQNNTQLKDQNFSGRTPGTAPSTNASTSTTASPTTRSRSASRAGCRMASRSAPPTPAPAAPGCRAGTGSAPMRPTVPGSRTRRAAGRTTWSSATPTRSRASSQHRGRQRHRARRPRRMADLRHHDDAGRHPQRIQLRVHRRARR